MRISDWSSDVCSSDLPARREGAAAAVCGDRFEGPGHGGTGTARSPARADAAARGHASRPAAGLCRQPPRAARCARCSDAGAVRPPRSAQGRSEEHTSELQSLMRISYAVFCLKKKKTHTTTLINKRIKKAL